MRYRVEVSMSEIYSSPLLVEFDLNALPLSAPIQGLMAIEEKTGCLNFRGGSYYRGVAFRAVISLVLCC